MDQIPNDRRLLRDTWSQEKRRLKISGIYKITNKLTEEFYIGASQNIFLRWNAHLSLIRSGKHYVKRLNEIFQLSGLQHPLDVFEIEVLEKTTDLKHIEVEYIAKFNPPLNKQFAGIQSKSDRPERLAKQLELRISESMWEELQAQKNWRKFVRRAIRSQLDAEANAMGLKKTKTRTKN